jgi:hypothetical protein
VTPTTEGLGAPLAEFLAEQIPRMAAKAHRRHRYVPAEDYEQAMWLKALSRGPHMRKLHQDGQYGLITLKLRDECSRVTREDRRYRLAVKASRERFSVYDIEFYSKRTLAMLLAVLIEAEFDVASAMEGVSGATDSAGVHIRTTDPFSGAENHLTALADVAAAYKRLPEGMQRLLRTYYGVSQEDTDEGRWAREGLAGSMGLTVQALRMRVQRALDRLQGELGGCDPWL